MWFEWIGREGGMVFSWWLLTLLAGVAVYPLFYRLMGSLPSRGYPLARAAGLMLVGFTFWILNILGLLQNTPGSTILAAALILIVGLVSYFTWQDREPILPWLRDNLSLILFTEVLFAVMFVGWTTVRAMNPEIQTTEKPMEIAFLSATRRSATFPPHDPWMAGYAISYYHFGYIIIAMVANMGGVSNGAAFDMGVPLLFALTGIGAFSIAYDLVMAHLNRREEESEGSSKPKHGLAHPRWFRRQALGVGLLATIFAVIMGNLGVAAIEIPYQTCSAPASYLRFMDLEERDQIPATTTHSGNCNTSNSADPANWNYWWWFRYSRVVRDHNLDGSPIGVQPITEMPIFSFVLADMHPHVLALPFAMLAIGLGLNLAMRNRPLDAWEVFLYAVYVGGMIFLNSWDAVYLGLIVGAEALRRLIANGTGKLSQGDFIGLLRFGLALVGLTLLLYAPFFISFRSQAGGIVPNVLWPTQFQQFFLMFGPFLVIIGVFLAVEVRRAGSRFNTEFAWQAIGAVVIFLVLAFVILAGFAWFREDVRQTVFQVFDESGGLGGMIFPVITRRLSGVLTEGTLLLILFAMIGRLFAREPRNVDGMPDVTPRILTYSPATGYALLIIAAGAVLTLAPDFVYLRDDFGVRINTVFKLYYQGWLLWSIGAAYGLWSVLFDLTTEPIALPLRSAFGAVATILILLCMLYPLFAIDSRAFAESGRRGDNPGDKLTLDGGTTLAVNTDDYEVIKCLAGVAQSDGDVVAEATDPHISYNHLYGRVSGLSGIPTVIGWENHERQWRGPTFDQAAGYVDTKGQRADGRAAAVGKLYNSTDWAQVQDIIKRYRITFVYVGPTERQMYTEAGLAKFSGLPSVCSSGNVAVYSADSIGAQTPSSTGG